MSHATDLPHLAPVRIHLWVSMPAAWVIIAAAIVVETAWASMVGMTITGVAPSAAIVAIFLVPALAYRRLGRSTSIADGMELLAMVSAFTHVGCVLTYLAARTQRPLMDEFYASTDARLGFAWMRWHVMMLGYPLIKRVLDLCYSALVPEAAGIALLGFLGYGARARAFVWAAIVSIALTSLIAGLFPSESAPAYFHYSPMPPYYDDILALRSTAPVTFALARLYGIVSFPSYHAALAIAFVWAFRGFGWWTLVAVILNAAMLLSALGSGGHYLVDLIAGIIAASLSITVAQSCGADSLRLGAS